MIERNGSCKDTSIYAFDEKMTIALFCRHDLLVCVVVVVEMIYIEQC